MSNETLSLRTKIATIVYVERSRGRKDLDKRITEMILALPEIAELQRKADWHDKVEATALDVEQTLAEMKKQKIGFARIEKSYLDSLQAENAALKKVFLEVSERVIKISKEDSAGMGEVYAEWYSCPNCDEPDILCPWAYCPHCGFKLEWVFAETHKRR